MKSQGKSKLGLAVGVLAASLFLAACDNSVDADLRVIHASDDAPPVNVRVGKKKAISDLDYAESSGYVAVRSGTRKVVVEAIIPGGNADVIKVNRFKFARDTRYNILAVNKTADIEPLVIEESAAEPELDQVAVAVVHAASVAGPVKIYVTEPDAPLNSAAPIELDYLDPAADAGALPVDSYQIRVTLDGKLVYDSGSVDLTPFAGDRLLIAALNNTNVTEQSGSPIKLLVANDIDQVTLFDRNTKAGARVVHLSPDAGTAASGPVEVFATTGSGSVELIPEFEYGDIVPDQTTAKYVGVDADNYIFDVAINGQGIGNSIYTSPSLTLGAGSDYSVIAGGYVGILGPTPPFELLATADDNRPVKFQASVKVIHAAPAAGTVDVYVTPSKKEDGGDFSVDEIIKGKAGHPLLKDFNFGDITEYVALKPGMYDIRVIAGNAAAINVEDFELHEGLVGTIIARQADGVGDPEPFGAVVLTNAEMLNP